MCRLEHHRRIASLLEQLNAELLQRHHCLFGGGTAIALRYGEFRQSVDVDLLVSDRQGYREVLAIAAPRAELWQRLINLQRLAAPPSAPAPH